MGTADPPPLRPLSAASRMKMHLRLLTINGYTYRIVTLRPGTEVVFSTNFFHGTWHIVTSQRGARLLARLLWGLAYERHPGTLILVHGDHLAPTPFEGERSVPFILAQTGLAPLDSSALRILKQRLPRLGAPTRTLRWNTFGLDKAIDPDRSTPERDSRRLRWKENELLWKQERMQRIGGFICYSAPPSILREQSRMVHRLRTGRPNYDRDMDYHFLAGESSNHSWYGDGEVQIFADYMDRVHAANAARRELVDNPNQAIISESVQENISRLRDRIKSACKFRKRHRIARGKLFRVSQAM